MGLEIMIEDARWSELDLEALGTRAYDSTLAHLGIDSDSTEAALLACDDAHIARLNADFRDKPTPTNVLSWPAEDLAPATEGAMPRAPGPDITGEIALGDIAIAYETCAREAMEAGKPLSDHVTHLVIHGVLHLLGYDHIRDRDATLMEQTETTILGTMGIDDPYKTG